MIGRIGIASFLLLAIVLAGLALHALWALTQSNESLSRVRAQHDLVDLYHASEIALLQAHASGERFAASGSAEDRAAFEADVDGIFTAITRLAVLGGEEEMALTAGILAEHQDKLGALPAYLDAVQAGEDPGMDFDGETLVPAVAAQLNTRRQEVDAQSRESIQAFSGRLDGQVYVAVVVFGLGVPLALAAMLFLMRYQKKERLAEVKLASLSAISRMDSLTGIGNLRAFQERLYDEIEACHGYGGYVSLALIDLDNLKKVNDERGHIEGDALLYSFASQMQELGHEGPGRTSAFRLGGDEFALLLPGQDTAEAKATVEKLRDRCRDALRGNTFSAGLATSHRGWPAGAELRQLADSNLYLAKGKGRDNVVTSEDRETAAA